MLSAQATDAGVKRATRERCIPVATPRKTKMAALGEGKKLRRDLIQARLRPLRPKAKKTSIALSEKLIRDFGGEVRARRRIDRFRAPGLPAGQCE